MDGWMERRAWLPMLNQLPQEGLETPLAMAKYELEAYFAGREKTVCRLDAALGEGFEITEAKPMTCVIYNFFAIVYFCGQSVDPGLIFIPSNRCF